MSAARIFPEEDAAGRGRVSLPRSRGSVACSPFATAECCGEKIGDNRDEARGATFRRHACDIFIAVLMTCATQARADDLHCIIRCDAARLESARQRQHVLAAEGLFEFGKRAQRQDQRHALTIEECLDFASMPVRHGLFRRKADFARAFEGEVERYFAVMIARELECGDLEWAGDRAEIGYDDFPGADGAREEDFADACIRGRVAEDAATGDRGRADARALE